jgi:transglutaminase-like putative cysteine protease
MKLRIQHHTTYRYTWPVLYSIQHVRLTPQQTGNQRILDWKVKTPAKQNLAIDHYGNSVLTFSVNQQHRELTVQSNGQIEIDPLHDGYLPKEPKALNPLVYTPTTPLTEFNDEMHRFASFVADKNIPFAHRLLTLGPMPWLIGLCTQKAVPRWRIPHCKPSKTARACVRIIRM